MIVLAILGFWLASLLPFVIIAYCAGRDDERRRVIANRRTLRAVQRGGVEVIR